MWRLGPTAVVGLLLVATLSGCSEGGGERQKRGGGPSRLKTSTVASGLLNPRGIVFGPDGQLYVAEAGVGGTHRTTRAQCRQVHSPVGPYSGGTSGRISRIDPKTGERTTLVDRLPSTQTSQLFGRIVFGVSQLRFLDGKLYVLQGGAGCSHGNPGTANGVYRVNDDGTWTLIADLSAFAKSHPVARPNARDHEPDGAWYTMIAARGALWAVEPQGGQVVRIDPETHEVTRLIDISASQGHVRPSAIAYHDGNFYVATFGTFPVKNGAQRIYKITPDGKLSVYAKGFTSAFDLEFHCGHPYVMELPPSRRVVRLDEGGKLETVVPPPNLKIMGDMTFGPDGALYLTDYSFFYRPPRGRIFRFELPEADRC
jgi:hypothetical protein